METIVVIALLIIFGIIMAYIGAAMQHRPALGDLGYMIKEHQDEIEQAQIRANLFPEEKEELGKGVRRMQRELTKLEKMMKQRRARIQKKAMAAR